MMRPPEHMPLPASTMPSSIAFIARDSSAVRMKLKPRGSKGSSPLASISFSSRESSV